MFTGLNILFISLCLYQYLDKLCAYRLPCKMSVALAPRDCDRYAVTNRASAKWTDKVIHQAEFVVIPTGLATVRTTVTQQRCVVHITARVTMCCDVHVSHYIAPRSLMNAEVIAGRKDTRSHLSETNERLILLWDPQDN